MVIRLIEAQIIGFAAAAIIGFPLFAQIPALRVGVDADTFEAFSIAFMTPIKQERNIVTLKH